MLLPRVLEGLDTYEPTKKPTTTLLLKRPLAVTLDVGKSPRTKVQEPKLYNVSNVRLNTLRKQHYNKGVTRE